MREKRVNKKGIRFGLERLINIIIAVICIAILVYLGYKIYDISKGKSDLEKATEVLKKLKEKVEMVKNSGGEDSIIIFPPQKWMLRGLSKGTYIPPGICTGYEYCLCICDDPTCVKTVQRTCTGFDFSVKVNGKYLFDSGVPTPGIDLTQEFENTIGFVNSVSELKFVNENGAVIISETKK